MSSSVIAHFYQIFIFSYEHDNAISIMFFMNKRLLSLQKHVILIANKDWSD